MDPDEFLEFAKVAIEKTRTENIHREWCSVLPIMAFNGKIVPFEEYLNDRTGKNIDTRSNEEIIAEIRELHEKTKNKES